MKRRGLASKNSSLPEAGRFCWKTSARVGFLAGHLSSRAIQTFVDVAVVSVAMVSNAVDHDGEQFNTGSQHDGLRIIKACARALKRTLTDLGQSIERN